jgi:drug/metabolite transporter (DMT)-like permease
MFQTTSYAHPAILAVLVVYAIAVLWAVIVTIRDRRIRRSDKVVWAGALVILPAVGLVAWLILRLVRRQKKIEGHSA